MCEKCKFPNDIVVKPDGENILDPCVYEEIERYENVTVLIHRCIKCGHIDISWERQENTEQII